MFDRDVLYLLFCGHFHSGGSKVKLYRIICIIGLMLFISISSSKYVSAQVIDGPIARKYLERTSLKLLYQENFGQLEAMAQEFS